MTLEFPRGPGRNPGASLYTSTRLSLHNVRFVPDSMTRVVAHTNQTESTIGLLCFGFARDGLVTPDGFLTWLTQVGALLTVDYLADSS